MSHRILVVVTLLAFGVPSFVFAGTLSSISSSFAEKVKAIFVEEKIEDNQNEVATSQTMALFKPVVVDEELNSAEVSNDENDSLSVVSGSLRISTEDIDFPMSDTVSVYEVKKGDSLATVAKLFGVSKNTIIWANDLKSQTISQGDTLVILPMTGIKHVIKKGDTLPSIAKKYKADTEDISKFNGISVDSPLALGETILVPDGEIEIAAPVKSKTLAKKKTLKSYSYNAPSGFLTRPVLGGRRSQGLHGHNGIDIAATPGTPVVAAASGRVIVAKAGGYNGGYGSMVIISHSNGVQTLYAHLRAIYITPGTTVEQGQTIGEVGNTGRSSGPHLHFEVRGAKNPF